MFCMNKSHFFKVPFIFWFSFMYFLDQPLLDILSRFAFIHLLLSRMSTSCIIDIIDRGENVFMTKLSYRVWEEIVNITQRSWTPRWLVCEKKIKKMFRDRRLRQKKKIPHNWLWVRTGETTNSEESNTVNFVSTRKARRPKTASELWKSMDMVLR